MKKGVWYELPSVLAARCRDRSKPITFEPLRVQRVDPDTEAGSIEAASYMIETWGGLPYPLEGNTELNAFVANLVNANECREVIS